MPMYNLIECSDNYSMMTRSLWNCYRDEVNDDDSENDNANKGINNNKTTTSESLEYKTKIIGSTPNNNNNDNILDAEVVIPLKYFSNFWKSLDLLLI